MTDTYYKECPFEQPKPLMRGTIFKPGTYQLSLLLVTLPPISLRVFLYALAHLEADGSVALSPTRMKDEFRTDRSYIAKGIRLLVKYDFLAPKKRSQFWLSNQVALPIRY